MAAGREKQMDGRRKSKPPQSKKQDQSVEAPLNKFLSAVRRLPQSAQFDAYNHAAAVLIGRDYKSPGCHKGTKQKGTPERIINAAALLFLEYPLPGMVRLLYPGHFPQHPKAANDAFGKFFSRNKAAIEDAVRTMTLERAENIKQSLRCYEK